MSDLILVKSESTKLVVKKSEFYSYCFLVDSRQNIKDRLELIRSDHPQANHVIHGAVYGFGNSKSYSMSDDGEPKGTAGKPVLELLKRKSITNCLLVVVRYFGGTKLGFGGLIRAYLESAKLCLEQSQFEEYKEKVAVSFLCSYELHGKIKTCIGLLNPFNYEEVFGERIKISFLIEKKDLPIIESKIIELSNGSIVLDY